MVSFASQKTGLKCLNHQGSLSGKSLLPFFLPSVILLQFCFRALWCFTINLSMPMSSSVYFKTMPCLSTKLISLIALNESNFKAFIDSCWICIKTSLFEDFFKDTVKVFKILETSKRSVWSNVSWYVKVFLKVYSIHYTLT